MNGGAEIRRKRRTGLLRLANWRTLLVFLIIAASLLGSIVLIYETVEAERKERQQMQRTNEVLLELRNISRAAINAEAGQRGYFITLNRQYLTPYTVGQESYRSSLGRLDSLLGPDRTQRQAELYKLIEADAEEKFTELEQSVELIASGQLRDARRSILVGSNQETMQSLRQNIRQMENMENRLLADATAQTAITEGRVLPLLGGLFLLILIALIFGFEQASRAARAEAEAANAAALGQARDRADLLARELNHRVKNIFAVILAIVRMTGRDAPESKPVIDRISERIHALLTAHEVTQGSPEQPLAELQTLIETSFAPYSSEARGYSLEGSTVRLPAKHVTPLGLVLHELTTNAVKYGAWADGGRVDVRWEISGGDLIIEWREFCSEKCEPGTREGFGSLLMTSAARQLQGSIERSFDDNGARIDIRFPLKE
ncbi:CHASE3 domain-containing protein [Altererythrobacter sp. ZODW24]|uniref:CHASE3 domain-containing protein n=1 Tax=Altererythrobacter sp. ZODW24 TaxID=2185142 RepID=UPI000DF7F4B7|nr:CHASE3 domain-containing protein [Altererythrobacter sp. ZODW24]